jgi:hypothetical protein
MFSGGSGANPNGASFSGTYSNFYGEPGNSSYGAAGGGGSGGIGAPGSPVVGGDGGNAISHSISNPNSSPTGMAVPASGGKGGSPNTSFTPSAGNSYGGGGGGGSIDSTGGGYFYYGASGASGIVVVITWYSS